MCSIIHHFLPKHQYMLSFSTHHVASFFEQRKSHSCSLICIRNNLNIRKGAPFYFFTNEKKIELEIEYTAICRKLHVNLLESIV